MVEFNAIAALKWAILSFIIALDAIFYVKFGVNLNETCKMWGACSHTIKLNASKWSQKIIETCHRARHFWRDANWCVEHFKIFIPYIVWFRPEGANITRIKRLTHNCKLFTIYFQIYQIAVNENLLFNLCYTSLFLVTINQKQWTYM